MIHHEETQLNANRNTNTDPKGGTKVHSRHGISNFTDTILTNILGTVVNNNVFEVAWNR